MDGAALSRLYRFSDLCVRANLKSVNHEESLFQPRPAGNCINWNLGHLLASRNALFDALGLETFWDESRSRTYRRGCPPLVDPEEAVPLEELFDLWESTQQTLLGYLKGKTAEELAAVVPHPDDFLGRTKAELLGTLAVHETYHGGQLGLLRRLVGREGAIP
jgi:uncharacterized damage-inducible protein DinB